MNFFLKNRNFLVASLVFATIAGCGGPSTEDLMMRAAQRSRSDDEEESGAQKPAQPTVAPQTQTAESTLVATSKSEAGSDPMTAKVEEQATDQAAKRSEDVKPSDVLDTLDELAIEPIEQRKPSEERDDASRRKQAVENLTKITKALQVFHEEKGHYPAPAIKSENGVATLSWRVTLLPYLGHDELYKKFDPSRPWNYEPNKSLMQYIPDVYVSPERYDTKTNIQFPAFRTFMFGSGMARKRSDVDKEDGSANTIMLLEVNDNLAVEWTKPADYVPKQPTNLKADLGGLRGDGTFAVWGNGWTTLLANGLTNQQIFNAMTYDAGDGQLAGTVHRDIPLEDASDASLASADRTPDASMLEAVDSNHAKSMPILEVHVREPRPIAGALAKAQSRLRDIYLKKMVEAKEDDEKADLAREMVQQSSNMPSDPAGAYALQTAAVRLSSDGGKLDPVIRAVDIRVGRFEVDAYDENVSALLKFAESTTKREPGEIDGDRFVERAIRVIFAGIQDDDYVRASALARHSYRMLDQERDDEIKKSLNRLRVLLSSAKREYDKAAVSLASYRDNPDLVDDAAKFGRFLCFIKGDWETGLPLVAMGSSQTLSEIAKRDIADAQNSYDQVAIGDAWWRLSESIRNGVYRQALQDRAAHWYQLAWPVMPESLDRIHVKNRLDELEDLPATSPLALVRKLADDLGVDLSTSLASTASVGQVRRTNPDDDDD